jgi:outer membrane protein, heavy metal efflux system
MPGTFLALCKPVAGGFRRSRRETRGVGRYQVGTDLAVCMAHPSTMCLLRCSHCLLVTLSVLLGSGTALAQPADFASLSLRQAVDRALARNALVIDSTLEWRRAQGAADGVAGVLVENPVFSAEGGVRRDQGFGGNQPSVALRLDQPLDVLGQASARRRAAGDLVTFAKARLGLVRAEIAARVHTVYVMAQVAATRIALEEERLATARQTAEALQMRVRLGASSDIDLRMAQAEVGRAEAAVQNGRARATRALLALRELLELPASASAQTRDALLPPPANDLKREGQADILAHHLSVQVVEKRRLAIDSEIARLERERLPRIGLGLAAERPSEQERFLGLGLSITPALWRRNQGPLAEARVERERTELEKAVTLAGLERRWTALVDEQVQRMAELKAMESTLENEEAVRTLVRAGWQAGKFDFLRVLLAERSLADTKQARLELWADLWTNAVEMNRLLGREP